MVVLEEGYVVKFHTNDNSKKYLYIERTKAGAINAMIECCENVLDLENGQNAYVECFKNGNSLYKTNFLHFLKVDISWNTLTFRPRNENRFSKIEYNDEEKDLKFVLWELLHKEFDFDVLEKELLKGISFSDDFLTDLPELFVYGNEEDFPCVIDDNYFSSDEDDDGCLEDDFEFIEGLNKL